MVPLRHFFRRKFRYTTDISVNEEELKSNDDEVTCTGLYPSTAPSHGMTDVQIEDFHEELPSISEVVAVVDEILDAIRAQRNELRSMTHEQSLTTFHHILPVCSFHTHSTNNITNCGT